MRKIFAALLVAAAVLAPARADYQYQSPQGIIVIKSGVLGGAIVPYSSPVDQNANPFGIVGNPFYVQFPAPQHIICDTGCSGGGGGGGTSSNFGAAFPAAGTAAGMSQGGNMVPLNGTAGNLRVDGSSVTQPVSAASLPLPSGAATSALQTSILTAIGTPMQQSGGSVTANAGTNLNTSLLALEGGHLASIDGKTPALGQALSAGSVPVVLTAAQLSTLTPPAALTNYALETGGNLGSIATSVARIPAQGQALAGASMPVVLPAAQITALTPPAAITGFALDATVQTTNTDLGPPGATACATDTGSCSLNALAQRLAQRLTTINTTLGTPLQAGGSIGNTSFGATQATAANLNATVVGTGTFAVQAAQSGAYNITNISGTVSLPTGAGTAANQTAVQAPVAAATATATKSVLLGGQFDTTQKTLTNGQQAALSVSARGAAFVAVGADGFAVTLASTTITGTVAVTQSGSWSLAANQSVNVAQINGVTPLMGNGVTGTGSQRVTIASDNTAFTVNAAQSGAWNITNISGTVSLPTGAATSANQTNGTQQSKITDGTNLATVKAASTGPVAADTALVVAASPNAGNTVVATAPNAYSAGNFKYAASLVDGSVATNGPGVLGTFTCSSACASTVIGSFNAWPYTAFSISVSVSDGSLVQLKCDNGDGNFSVVVGMYGIDPTGDALVGQSFLSRQAVFFTPTLTVKRCQLFIPSFGYNGATVTMTVMGSQGPSPTTSVSGSVNTTALDINGNTITGVPTATTVAAASLLWAGHSGVIYKLQAQAPAVADHLMIFNQATVPSNGTVTPSKCYPVGNGGYIEDSWLPGPPPQFINSGGNFAVAFSTGGTCYNLTLAGTTGSPYISIEAR